jgi:glycosyltransferase involved in cell wall biosynthesis
MHILFDLSSAQPQKEVIVNGGGEYSFSLLVEYISYLENKQSEDIVDVLFDKNKGSNLKINEFLKQKNIECKEYADLEEFSKIVNFQNYDLLVCPIMYPYYSKLKISENIKVVGLIHDMSNFYHYYLENNYGEFISGGVRTLIRNLQKKIETKRNLKENLKEHELLFGLNKETHVFTVSNYTYYALKYFLPNCNVEGVHYSISKKSEVPRIDDNEFLSEIDVSERGYFLMSSCSRWAKNNLRAAECIDELITSGVFDEIKRKKVVMLGCNDRVKSYLGRKIKNQENFIPIGYVSDVEMELLYKNAFAFIYPSLLEGFGFPPVEAMKYDTLSVCSTSTSIPEICGDAVLYFDPYDKDSIKMALLQSFDEEIRKEKRGNSVRRLSEITDRQKRDTKLLLEKIDKILRGVC